MPISISLMRKLELLQPSIREAFLALMEEIEQQRKHQITRDEFIELVEVVRELAEAQKRTELRVEELAQTQKRTEIKVEQLAEAQKRTELRVEELAQAQKHTETRLEELAQAQKRTEIKVEQLAEAQKRTELRIEELAQAQKRTENEVALLVRGLRDTRKMVGALADTIGYGLEDKAMKSLPDLLKERYGILVDGRLERTFLTVAGAFIECNIFGQGRANGEPVTILGEAKSQLARKHIRAFKKKALWLEKNSALPAKPFLILVTYLVQPDLESVAEGEGIHIVKSFEL